MEEFVLHLKKKAVKKTKKVKGKSPSPRKVRTQLEKDCDEAWSRKVKDIWDWKCAFCGATSHLNSHHIFSRKYKSTRWDIGNGICLCLPHHRYWAHSKFEEFRDFVLSIIGEKYYRLKEKSQKIAKYSMDDLREILEVLK